ncbi:hypothetical protein J3F83DRAFT_365610 [Trichoderma novae-zelandiae]
MDIVNTSTSGIQLPLLLEQEGSTSGSIDSNMEEATQHARHDGVDSNSTSGCDVASNRKSASIQVEPTTDETESTLLSRVRNGLSSIGWGLEMIAMATSFACMGVLVWVLALFQNRQLTDWSFWISLNAVVAIAATTAKATLLASISACLSQEKWQHFSHRSHYLQDMTIIDNASRGPMGSLQLLVKVSWGFASVGAIVTVLSLATDAFVQQIINYESDTIYTLVEGTAVFQYTHGYASGALAISEDVSNHSITYFDWSVDTLMQAAVLKAVYEGNRIFFPIEYFCFSNCTWDQDYAALGFSSTCVDVTEETMETMHCLNSTEDRIFGRCKLMTPGGIQFDTSAYTSAEDNISHIGNDLAIAVGSSNLKYDVGPVINGSDLFRTAVWIWDNRGRGKGGNDLVTECSLGVAIYNYSNISTTQYDATIGATEKIPLGNNTGATLDRSGTYFGDNLLWWNDTGPGQPDIYISLLDLAILADFFKSPSFSGGHSSVTSSGNYHPGAAGIFHSCTHSYDDEAVKSCISEIFDSIAISMTSVLQQGGTEVAQGLTSQIVVYIRVRWAWLILPLFVQFLGGIALIVTILGRKRTKNVPLWKASPIALLYHSVDEDGILVTGVKDPGQLEQNGKSVKAVLDL